MTAIVKARFRLGDVKALRPATAYPRPTTPSLSSLVSTRASHVSQEQGADKLSPVTKLSPHTEDEVVAVDLASPPGLKT